VRTFADRCHYHGGARGARHCVSNYMPHNLLSVCLPNLPPSLIAPLTAFTCWRSAVTSLHDGHDNNILSRKDETILCFFQNILLPQNIKAILIGKHAYGRMILDGLSMKTDCDFNVFSPAAAAPRTGRHDEVTGCPYQEGEVELS